ncbi:MAG: DUF488 family protein [Anaerolineae bacterium]|nr:DUF488 family protein [Anaerolineae bacterium]
MITIHIKSIYLEPTPDDGFRVLVDRQLPPGLTLESARVDLWLGEIAPSPRLQKWFRNDRDKWDEFVENYYAELDGNSTAVTRLFQEAPADRITLLFTAKDARYNTAVALKRYLEGEE